MEQADTQSLRTNEEIEINRILTAVAEYNASDLHLSVGNAPTVRVDGELVALREEKVITPDFMKKLSLFFLDEKQREILNKEREIVFSYNFQGRIRFKVDLFYQEGYLSASLRLIPSTIKNLKELGLPLIVEKFHQIKKGLVIVCGPFASGRSFTITALINEVNNHRKEHILTVEKPIEFVFNDNQSIIEQREVGRDTNSFEQALKAAFRGDIDVIMIGEMKSKEVIKNALDLAEGGRLVYSAMETDSSIKTIERIINSFESEEKNQVRVQLAEVLEGIIVQRLVPRVGGGRILVTEILVPNPATRSIIREGNIYQINNVLQTSRGEGMVSLDRALAELVKTGEIMLENAIQYAVDENNLKRMAQR
ncbi:MAG: type IV pili twitching motility protein PilT [Candidatus Kerfeldbacteria bacterium CG_4_10_14_0_8_um_filter_42_10]|uniref:Type IV pili twitching motility protein PilT n=1 Tax=Candidatus Kerfeldbacteria bacterium CG_4_10_14_0_8_um_filter_42_10 TaxID=2014248 RepID=A0A2M7RKA3_9BACT|nr:MAG: type IV pili twitching motility protein PilT [Candidatus Kerfeldbacteria bacterium CG_4_10_14_0_8_um_filter_42_10]